jgi:hypothetical protein
LFEEDQLSKVQRLATVDAGQTSAVVTETGSYKKYRFNQMQTA